MAFEEVLGQKRVIDGLSQVLTARQFPHAFLIEGGPGMGKKTFARSLAEAIAGKHSPFAIHWIEDSGAVKIEAIRQLHREMMLRPAYGEYKIFIICQAESMTVQAQNALLKTLEEPPAYGVMLLLTVNANSLLSTVTSRCQRIKLLPLSVEEISARLVEQKGVEPGQARTLAALSSGSLGKALLLLEDEAFLERRRTMLELSLTLLKADRPLFAQQEAFFLEHKDRVEELLELLTSWYRDLLIYQETRDFQFVINCDRIEEVERQSRQLGIRSIQNALQAIDTARRQLKSNVNYQLAIQAMLLNIQEGLSW